MKLSNFARLVKSGCFCRIIRLENGDVWLGTRTGLYRAFGLPKIRGREEVKAVMSLSEKDMEKISLEEEDAEEPVASGLNLRDYDSDEVEAEKSEKAEKIGLSFSALEESGELVFYNNDLLLPVADVVKDSEYLNFTIRHTQSGQAYIAVKDGVVIQAVILPMKIVTREYLGMLQEFEAACTAQLYREEEQEQAESPEEE